LFRHRYSTVRFSFVLDYSQAFIESKGLQCSLAKHVRYICKDDSAPL